MYLDLDQLNIKYNKNSCTYVNEIRLRPKDNYKKFYSKLLRHRFL